MPRLRRRIALDRNVAVRVPLPSGRKKTAPARWTPGIVSRVPRTRETKPRCDVASSYLALGMVNWKEAAPSGLNPGSTPARRRTLTMSRAAPTSSTSASEIWVTTSPARKRLRRRLPLLPFPSPRNDSAGSFAAATSAGASPKANPTTTETRNVNPRTRPSIEISLSRGMPRGLRASSASTDQVATRRPRTPPRTANRTASASTCRTRRHRVAPRAARTATSRCRVAARARKRLATLAQAMRSTNPTAPHRSRSAGLIEPTASVVIPTTVTPRPVFWSGYSTASARATVLSSCWAPSIVAEGVSRPTTS